MLRDNGCSYSSSHYIGTPFLNQPMVLLKKSQNTSKVGEKAKINEVIVMRDEILLSDEDLTLPHR